MKVGNGKPIRDTDHSNTPGAADSYRSMGEILSSMDPGLPTPVSGTETSAEKSANKSKNSNLISKRSTFWGRSNVSHYSHGANLINYNQHQYNVYIL